MKKPTYQELERKIKELQAQSATNLRAAQRDIQKADDQRMMASAVIIQISALGGREIVPPFAICNGLNKTTIDAIKTDIIKTMEFLGFNQ